MKVFISSTYVDLIEYRKKAVEVFNRYQCIPVAMEFFGSQSEDATTVCAEGIRDCDIFIGIYAYRYGWVPEGQEKSITRMEYELAKELEKECLCFIVKEDFPWNPKLMEMAKLAAHNDFLAIVKTRVLDFFTTPEDFAFKLATSLANAVKKQKGEAVQKGEKCLSPDAPFPYIAHTYALQRNFTGRQAEMAVLSNWFFNDTEPVLVLEAIGGMGKSAMSWVWVQKEIIGKLVETDGVFWWSFYEEPFEDFIRHLACYVLNIGLKEDFDLTSLMVELHRRRFLLVLDGLERALRGYAGMEAMYIQEKGFDGDTEAEARWDRRVREPVDPVADRFFREILTGKTRTLITTRLMPSPLDGLYGVKRVCLTGLSPEDTVRFLRGEGVNGTRAELEEASRVYDFHPLMLTLLAASIVLSRARDIRAAYSMNLIERDRPFKILSTAFGLLSEAERGAAERVSVFRGVFSFDAVKSLMLETDEERLWGMMQGLRRLGFVFYDETADCFDLHPIMRSFLYGRLSGEEGNGEAVHTLAVEYFKALPEPEKVVTLEDLGPVIELYHHLVRAGKFDEAFKLFRDRIVYPTYYQLSAYHLIIELLKPLFPGGDRDNGLPRLEKESAQGWTLNELANTYSLSGWPAKAVPLYLQYIRLSEKNDDKKNAAISLGNAAQLQLQIGQFSASTAHLRKSIALCREINDEFYEAIGHKELGRVLAFQGKINGAEEEFKKAFETNEKRGDIQALSLTSAYRSLSALLQARAAAVRRVDVGKEDRAGSRGREALEQARRALTFAEKDAKEVYPLPRDFVQAYWLLGEALILCGEAPVESFEIPFYDEHFQQKTETVPVTTGNPPAAAERCLHEALRRCRKVNLVEFEPDILLGLSRLDRANRRPPEEKRLEEVMEIALRAGYRRVLADLHLFCAQVLLESGAGGAGPLPIPYAVEAGSREPASPVPLLGLPAGDHLQKARDYARDVSEFSDLYQSAVSNPDFYNDIPEYDMLKRGMNEDERVKNGYLAAFQMAEELGKD